MFKNIIGALTVVSSSVFLFGCSDIEDDAFVAYKCVKAAEIFSDQVLKNNALLEVERITQEGNVGNSSAFVMNIGQRARDEYEPYGSSTSKKFKQEVFTDWYESDFCENLKEEDLYGKRIQEFKKAKVELVSASKITISDDLTVIAKGEEDFLHIGSFLSKNKGSFVKLEISSCQKFEAPCGTTELSSNSLSFNAQSEQCEYNSSIGSGIVIYFNDSNESSQLQNNQDLSSCDFDNKSTLINLSGVFKVPEEPSWGQGWTEWFLEPISRN